MRGTLGSAGHSRIVFALLFAGLFVLLAGGTAFAQVAWPITASSGGNGAISPGGIVYVANGAGQSFAFIPDPGYMVYQVIIDGNAVAANAAGYTFGATYGAHSILVLFTPGSYYGGVVVVPAPDIFLFGGGFDRRRDADDFRRRGVESRGAAHPERREPARPERRQPAPPARGGPERRR